MVEKSEHNGVLRRTDGVEIKDHFDCLLVEIDKRYEQRFEAQERATTSALASAQLAVDKAEANTRDWQANANEWRGAMNDKDKLLATKSEVCARLDAVDLTLGELKTIRDIAIGKASQSALLVTAAIAVAGLIIALIKAFVK